MFKNSSNKFLKTDQAGGYRVDIGLAGIIAFGGEFLSIVKEEEEEGKKPTDIVRDSEDSKIDTTDPNLRNAFDKIEDTE